MKVLLTGASGFIGSYILKELVNSNIETVVVGRVRPEKFTGKFIKSDLLVDQNLNEIVKQANADHLIHLAWYAEHRLFWESELNLRWIEASVRLAEAFCSGGGKKIIAMGSCAEYDWTFGYCKEDETPTDPKSLYGISKDVTRRLLHEICKRFGVSLLWIRPFFIFGIGENSQKIIPSLINFFQGRGQRFDLNYNSYRDFIHVSDVASSVLLLLKNDVNGIYNISSGKPIQIGELVRMIAHIYSKDDNSLISKLPNASETRLILGDCSKLERLGWTQSNFTKQLEMYCKAIK